MKLSRRRQTGLTLIELMVAMTLDLIIVAAVAGVFIKNSRYRTDIERANQQIENGRYGMQVLSDDLQMAGYLSTFEINAAKAASPSLSTNANPPYVPPAAPPPAFLPDPCDTTRNGIVLALTYHIEQYDNGAGAPTCITNVKPNTDIVVVRRTSACVATAGNPECDFVNGAYYFQASGCATQINAGVTSRFRFGRAGTATFNRTNLDCATLAPIRQFLTHIYFIANDDQPGDGIPTLKRAELGAGNSFQIVPIADGIEDLQLLFGIDSSQPNPADGAPDAYTSDPDRFDPGVGPCTGAGIGTPACILGNRDSIVSVRIGLLARSLTKRQSFSDTKTYTLANVNVGPFNDAYERRAFDGFVTVMNPSLRRQ